MYSYFRIPTLTFGPEVVVVFGATVILVVDAIVVLSHLEHLQRSFVNVVVSKRLQCQTDGGAIGLPFPGEDPSALLPVQGVNIKCKVHIICWMVIWTWYFLTS